MKKWFSLLLTLCLLLNAVLPALAQEGTRLFTDSTGREVTVPAKITRIAVTGPMTQHVVFALAPQMLVGISSQWDEAAKPYIPEKYHSLPVIGQLYGGKGTMNLEALLAAEPQLVIDVGEGKGSIAEDMDQLTQQTGIPFIHIDADLQTFDKAFVTLGELLGLENEAARLAAFCQRACQLAMGAASKGEKVKLLYIVGEEGLGVIAKDSYHASVIDWMSDNQAVVDSPSSRGTGNEVDMEQLLLWDPECIIFSPGGYYAAASEDPLWQNLTAIQNGRYYEAPGVPHNWMGFPPACQRLMGLLWMGEVLYPQAAEYDLYEELHTYFELFYHSDLSAEQFQAITANSIGRMK